MRRLGRINQRNRELCCAAIPSLPPYPARETNLTYRLFLHARLVYLTTGLFWIERKIRGFRRGKKPSVSSPCVRTRFLQPFNT